MTPSRFTYHAPGNLVNALRLVAESGDEAKVLAGGQSLPFM
ncbi:MAG: xanthine dehydrogenase family protein subunit M, partial [Candidatus Thermoplasmatota archaeon]|nr:xanthine dehydrogenase family protein subunit M [Candidatus Thermoplasmatota archaeon]